jgi:hypothetical protein
MRPLPLSGATTFISKCRLTKYPLLTRFSWSMLLAVPNVDSRGGDMDTLTLTPSGTGSRSAIRVHAEMGLGERELSFQLLLRNTQFCELNTRNDEARGT